MISRGLRGAEPLVKTIDYFRGAQAPKSSCIGIAFQSLLTLLPKCFVLL